MAEQEIVALARALKYNPGPAPDFFAISLSDTVAIASVIRGIYVGVGGDIVVKNAAGTTVTFKAVPQGAILPVTAPVLIVMSTGTTATNLVGLV
jgi:hypothetical protein